MATEFVSGDVDKLSDQGSDGFLVAKNHDVTGANIFRAMILNDLENFALHENTAVRSESVPASGVEIMNAVCKNEAEAAGGVSGEMTFTGVANGGGKTSNGIGSLNVIVHNFFATGENGMVSG